MSLGAAVGGDDWFETVRYLLDIKQGRRSAVVPVVDATGLQIGRLVPLTAVDLGNQDLLEMFVRWRNQNLAGYRDQRPVTLASTASWLREVVWDPARLAHLIHLGDKPIARCGAIKLRPTGHEADGLVRGERGGGIDFIFYTQVAGTAWSFHRLGGEEIVALILRSNDLALSNAERLGFGMEPRHRSPRWRDAAGRLSECPTQPGAEPTDELLSLVLARSRFIELHRSSPTFQAGWEAP